MYQAKGDLPMRYYIKSTKEAALMVFKRGLDEDYDALDAIEDYNAEVLTGIYNAIMDGTADYAYIESDLHMDAYTRSLRGDFVQISHFGKIDGHWVALSHTDATDAKKMIEETKTGCYINVA